MNLHLTNIVSGIFIGIFSILCITAVCFVNVDNDVSSVLFVVGCFPLLATVFVNYLFRRCPNCGRHLPPKSNPNYCTFCGEKLDYSNDAKVPDNNDNKGNTA